MARKLLEGPPELLRATGTAAEEASVAATAALIMTKANRYQGLTEFWPSFLLQRTFLYQRNSDELAFVSFGFSTYVTMTWQMDKVIHETGVYFHSPKFSEMQRVEAIKRLGFAAVTSLLRVDGTDHEEFSGVSTVVCSFGIASFIHFGLR